MSAFGGNVWKQDTMLDGKTVRYPVAYCVTLFPDQDAWQTEPHFKELPIYCYMVRDGQAEFVWGFIPNQVRESKAVLPTLAEQRSWGLR